MTEVTVVRAILSAMLLIASGSVFVIAGVSIIVKVFQTYFNVIIK